MAAPTVRDNWQTCYYQISASVTINGTTTVLKEQQIVNLLIEKDYDNDHLPIMIIGLSLSNDIDRDITSESTIQLRIDKVIGQNENGIMQVYSKSSFINDIFSFIVLEDTPSSSYFENLIYKKIERTEGDYLLQDASSVQTFILVKKECLNASKSIFNAVLKKATMTEATTLLLSQAGCTNVLMSNLDNTDEYKELIIPPLPLLENITYLKNYYGFHEEDTVVFMDFDTTYIVRKNGSCSAFKPRENTNVDLCLNASESPYNECKGVIYSGNTTYVNIASDAFVRNLGGSITDQTEGTNMLVFNENQKSSNTVSPANIQAIGDRSTNIKLTTGHNEFVNTQIEYRKYENQYVFTIGCTNADISLFTPNKQFSIISNSAEIAIDVTGNYRLSRHVTSFVKECHYFIPITNMTLKKTKA